MGTRIRDACRNKRRATKVVTEEQRSVPVALVTGSSRGIGRAIALEFARAGYDLAIHCRCNVESAREVADGIARLGRRAHVFQADLARPVEVTRLVEQLRDELPAIDVLGNNAGAAPRVREDILELSESEFDETFHTNFKGPFVLTQAIARWMLEIKKQDRDRRMTIINISSISEYSPTVTRAAYCIAKASMGMMTRLFAVRLATAGINVNEIRPGIVATDMTAPVKEKYDKRIAEGLTPIRRWGQPEDVARAARALASRDFDFATAAVVDVDGGFHLRVLE